MPDIVQVGSTTIAEQTTGTSINVAWPAGIQAGDVAVVCLTLNSIASPAVPGGFTLATDADAVSASPHVRQYVTSAGSGLTGSESGNLNVATNNSVAAKVQLRVFRYVDASNPVVDSGVIERAAGSNNYDMAVDTGAVAGCMFVYLGSCSGSAQTWTPPTTPVTMTEDYDDISPVPATGSGFGRWAGAGATTVNLRNVGATVRGAAVALALRPAPVAAAFTGWGIPI